MVKYSRIGEKMRFLEFLRREELPKKEESETERKLYGRTAIEEFEENLLLELKQETDSGVRVLFESKRKEAGELREKFQIIDKTNTWDELYPIEAFLFELHLTERLLRQAKLISSKGLRIDFESRDLSNFEKSKSRLKNPEEIHRQQKGIKEARTLALRQIGLILEGYASEIETDQRGEGFHAWALVFDRLAQRFTAVFFDSDQSEISKIMELKGPEIVKKRGVMLQEANLQLTS